MAATRRFVTRKRACGLFPMTMISKRIEDGDPFDVSELFDGLAKQLASLSRKAFTASKCCGSRLPASPTRS